MLALTVTFPWFVWLYVVMSLLTFIVYSSDKSRAAKGRWRIKEVHLHALELLWGWPGAFVAQRVLRHKNRKANYQVVFWLIVAIHLAVWVYRWTR
jgi:uncharacterized membrane protein YsdA (DUF1294 family)